MTKDFEHTFHRMQKRQLFNVLTLSKTLLPKKRFVSEVKGKHKESCISKLFILVYSDLAEMITGT